jgi:hypothetical protein
MENYHINSCWWRDCGTLLRDSKGFDNRLTVGVFLFFKGTMEDLKSSAVSLMRIKFATGLEDFVIKRDKIRNRWCCFIQKVFYQLFTVRWIIY